MKQMLSRLAFFCFEFFYILLTLTCTNQLSNCTTHNPVCVQAGLVLALSVFLVLFGTKLH